MRLSLDTLILLARLGDKIAEGTAIWLSENRDAVCSVHKGWIGAGWPGISDARKWPIRLEGKKKR